VTPFHHQPEAQHPKSSAIHKNAGRLSHLWANRDRLRRSNRHFYSINASARC
jgi:hypothetical protein